GLIYQTRGDLDQAEKMHRKSLAIEEKLGRLEGMAIQYGNLGTVYEQRGDVATAREYWTKARDLFEQIGIPHEVEKVQAWLDELEDEG
ncbi:MAG: tetratricopeptide repeat protein, partial [Phycisphaerae bacterium]